MAGLSGGSSDFFVLMASCALAVIGLYFFYHSRHLAKRGWEEYQLLADQHVASQDNFEHYSTRLIRKNQELEQRVNELTTLYGLSNAVSSTTDLNRIYAETSSSIAKLCAYDCFIFLEADATEKSLEVREASGVFSPWRQGDKILFNQGLIGRYAYWGQVALIEDIKDQSQAQPTAEEEWFKSLMIVPISVDGNLLAVLALARGDETPFSRNELYIVQSLACQIGTAIHRGWLYKKLEALAVTDGLTGLYNRRYFEETLAKEFARAQRYQLVLSVILIDVDHFKHYNDNNGHQAGDKLLQKISSIFEECIREVDVAARYGGEEFILVLPETTKEAALRVAGRIREKVNQLTAPGASDQPLGKISLSMGIASHPADALDQESLIKHADAALYLAKSSGRDQVIIYNAN